MKQPAPWPYPALFAHRGGGSAAPENTLVAMATGRAHYFTAVEFDVKLSADGIAILQRLLAEAEGRGDRVTMTIAKEKLSWVIDADGEPLPVTHPGDQLFLF